MLSAISSGFFADFAIFVEIPLSRFHLSSLPLMDSCSSVRIAGDILMSDLWILPLPVAFDVSKALLAKKVPAPHRRERSYFQAHGLG
jgi:hypothetical protein